MYSGETSLLLLAFISKPHELVNRVIFALRSQTDSLINQAVSLLLCFYFGVRSFMYWMISCEIA